MSEIARVVVDVTGVDKPFDYLVPPELSGKVVVGSRVRVPLHRREVSGWVAAVSSQSSVDAARLLPIARVSSIGPSAEVVELIHWAAHRWVSRPRPLFVSASPSRRVAQLVEPRRSKLTQRSQTVPAAVVDFVRNGGGVVQCGLSESPIEMIRVIAELGTVLVVAPTLHSARRIAAECRHGGLTTALYPDEWVAAASGVDVVIGARSTVWATVASLSGIVVVDEHDDTLQEERAPTWHARDVAVHRAESAGVPCVLFSPTPTVAARVWAGERRIRRTGMHGWPTIRVVDHRDDDPARSSLVTSALVEVLRDRGRRVVCVLNVKGRSRALVCDSCRTVARCEACGAAVSQPDAERLACPRCDTNRPVVCLACGSQRMRAIRVGVSRLRDELEAAAGRTVQEVSAKTERIDSGAAVFIGTEAVLHRVDRADVVVFLDVDAELLAPRFRASEQTLDLLVHGARVVADSQGELIIQTSVPDHELLTGLAAGDLTQHETAEARRREMLRLPPFGALAEITGAGADHYAEHLSSSLLVQVAATPGRVLVRAATGEALADALAAVPRSRQRARIAVDPVRA